MYRPQSQLNVQRSSDIIRDMHSKTKKLSNKQYKQYVKKLVQNTPNHIDTDRRYKQDNVQTSKNDLKQRLQKKPTDDQRQLWRSGVTRFIKRKLSQRDYKRFKKLFDIFSKIQKTRQEIMTLTVSNSSNNSSSITNRYINIKDNNSLYQNQKMKELKDNLLRLQLDEEKMLLEIENQGKENRKEAFSLEKVANAYRRHSQIEKRNGEGKDNNNDQLSSRQQQHIHSQSSQSQLLPTKPLPQPLNLLTQLYQLIIQIDLKSLKRPPTINKNKSPNIMYEQLYYFIKNKQTTIDQLFVSLTNVNNINHKDERVGLVNKEQEGKVGEQKVKQSQFCKFSEIDKRQRNGVDVGNGSSNRRFTSFKSLFDQIQQDLLDYKQMSVIKQRSNQLARRLLTTSKQLKLCEQDKIQTQRKLIKRIHELQAENVELSKQIEQLQSKNGQLCKQIDQTQTKMVQLSAKMAELQELQKQHGNLQKYYRQALTLQQEVKILSQQNQKLVKEIQTYREKQAQMKEREILQKQQKDRKQQQQQHIKLMRESNNSSAKLLITSKTPKQKHPQSDNTTVEKQTPSTHEKSIKPCSNTSLIYKEFEKKNKKLSQENKKLSEQISRLQQQKRSLSQQNKKTTEQILRVLQQNKCLTQEMMRVSEQNNTMKQLNSLLQQKIHYNEARSNQLIQKHLSTTKEELTRTKQSIHFLEKQNKVLLQQNKKIEQEFEYLVKEKLEIESHMNDLEKQRLDLLMQGHRIRVGLGERLVEVEEMVNELREEKDLLKKCCGDLQRMMREGLLCVGEEVSGALQVFVNGMTASEEYKSQQDQQQQQIQQQQQSKQLTQQPKYNPQNHTLLIQQYQTLAIQFNHCLYELNEYKSMLNQSQIQKQLQRKYYQQDINLMRLQISKLEGQCGENNSKSVMRTKKEKLKINCELLEVHVGIGKQCSEAIVQTEYEQLMDRITSNLSLHPQTIQLSCYQENQSNNIQQEIITFSQWLTQLQTDPELKQQQFAQFCITQLSQDTLISKLNQEQKQKHQPSTTTTHPQKQFAKIEVIQQETQEKIGIFGSLYNKFSFPKLEATETKYELSKKTTVREMTYNNSCQTVALNKNTITNTNAMMPRHHQPPANSIQTQVYSMSQQQPVEDEQESFDLCII